MSEPMLSGHLAWQRACDLAARRHEGQRRANGVTPYASHPTRVAITLAAIFEVRDERILAAAVMHDLIEDTTVDFDEIAEQFDPEIAGWVAAVSKDMRMEHGSREAAYDEGLAGAPWQARLIKIGDVYDNLSDAAEADRLTSAFDKAQRVLDLAGDEPELQLAMDRLKEWIVLLESRS